MKELINSTEDFTPEKRLLYKDIIKNLYKMDTTFR